MTSPTATVTTDRGAPRRVRSDDLRLGPALVVLGAMAIGYLLLVAGSVDAPFGNSYEGRNGGTWGAGSEAIREHGPIASGLGARHDTGLTYARHPPLIYPLTATSELLLGDRPLGTRAPSLAAAIATIGLLYVLLRTVRIRRVSALIGTGIVASASMFTVYGPMPDTPMLGLPLGLGLAIAWVRRQQRRPLAPRVEFLLALAAALTAWQAVFIALTIAGVEALRAAPGSAGLSLARRCRAAAPFLAGTAIGLTLTLLWVIWATGGPGQLLDALSERSGSQGGVDYPAVVEGQLVALIDLFGLAVFGLVALFVAIRSPRHRPLGLLLLTAVFGYMAITPTGASGHDYWLYWAIAPIALGWGLAADAAFDADRVRTDHLAGTATVLLALVLVAAGVFTPSRAGRAIEQGTEAGSLVTGIELAEGQDSLETIGVINHLATWITLEAAVDTAELADRDELLALAERRPDDIVLATTWCAPDDDGYCTAITGGGGTRTDHDYVLLTAAEAADRLDEV